MSSVSDIKTQLWAAATRLQRSQSKLEHLAQASRKEIATLLAQELRLRASDVPTEALEAERLLGVARLKGEKLLVDDEAGDLMSLLERYCDILLEAKLPESSFQLDQDCLEAVSGIVATSSRTDSSELHTLSQSLAQKYHDITSEHELKQNISSKLVPHVNPGRPSQTLVDTTLQTIAHNNGIRNWTPPFLLPEDRKNELCRLLDLHSHASEVDIDRLKTLCSHGIPDTPVWLRSRAWSILLGTTPKVIDQWEKAQEKGREDYVSLAEQILGALANTGPPSTELSPQDKMILQFSKDIEALPTSLRDSLVTVYSSSNTTIDIKNHDATSNRLSQLRSRSRKDDAVNDLPMPSITLDDPTTDTLRETSSSSTILLSSSSTADLNNLITDTLLRVLYIHSALHASHSLPMGPPPAMAAIFATVISVVCTARVGVTGSLSAQDATSSDIEAQVFWMVEAITGRVRELLEGGEEGEVWTSRFSSLVQWADRDLWNDLRNKGLDPALPYYSFRWIPALFTHALPLPVLLHVWDALISVSPPRGWGNRASPHTEFIYVMGTSMLVRARGAIFHSDTVAASRGTGIATPSALSAFWKRQSTSALQIQLPRSPSTYSPIASPKTPQSPTFKATPNNLPGWNSPRALGPVTPGNLANIFLIAVKILQDYDVDSFGGIERLLDNAWSLWRKWCREGGDHILLEPPAPLVDRRVREMRHEEDALSEAGSTTSSTVMESLSRLGNKAWKGMVNEVEDEDRSPSPDDRSERRVEAPTLTITSPVSETTNSKSFFSFGGGLGSKITESVWKGMTNQVDSPEPSPEASPVPSPTVPRHSASIPPIQSHTVVASAPSPTPEQNTSNTWSGEGAASWAKGYASKLWNSNTASSLSRAGTVLKNRASDAWSQGSASEVEPRSTTHSPSHSAQLDKRSSAGSSRADGFASPVGSWGDFLAKRGSLPLGTPLSSTSRDSDVERKRQSEGSPDARKWDAYSPPAKPTNFRSIRDSVMVSGIFGGGNDASDSSRIQTSPPSDSGSKNPLQAALAALSGSPKEAAPKRGPKPLLLNSSSLITPSGSRSGLSSRTPSRRPSPSPTPRPGDRFSISTTEGDDPITPGASAVVSLRRGPITNPRTAGYGPRDSMFSSRASTSGLSSPSLSSHGLSVEVEAPDEDGEYRSIRKQKSTSLKSGFLLDQGKPVDQLAKSAPPSVVKLNTSSDSSHDESTNGYISASSQMEQKEDPRSKRPMTKPAPILTSAPPDIPEVQVITPRSGERSSGQSDDAAIGKSPETSNNLQSDPDLPILDPRVSIGSSLTRSRTPRVKKPRRGSHEDRTPRGVTRQRGRGIQEDRNRASIVGASGSEEEGARADVEDLDDIYTMY